MAVTILEYTIMCLGLLRSGKLYDVCNKEGNVIETCALTVSRLFVFFMQRYILGGLSVSAVSTQAATIERAIRQIGVARFIKNYDLEFTTDEQAFEIIR